MEIQPLTILIYAVSAISETSHTMSKPHTRNMWGLSVGKVGRRWGAIQAWGHVGTRWWAQNAGAQV